MRDKGFTLVEILVAVAMVALLLTTVYGVFNSVSDAKQRLEAESEGYHQARVLFDRIGRELRGAYFDKDKKDTRFLGGTTTDKYPYLELSTTAGTPYGGRQGGISVVRYELRPDPEAGKGEDTRVLMRNEYSYFNTAGADRVGYRLTAGIGEMKVRFYSKGQWVEDWNARTDGLPELVEVTLSLPVEGKQVVFRTAYDIPGGGQLPNLNTSSGSPGGSPGSGSGGGGTGGDTSGGER
jgi:general secretion pathway protein J